MLDWLIEGWTNNEWIFEVNYTQLFWYSIDIQGGGNVGNGFVLNKLSSPYLGKGQSFYKTLRGAWEGFGVQASLKKSVYWYL